MCLAMDLFKKSIQLHMYRIFLEVVRFFWEIYHSCYMIHWIFIKATHNLNFKHRENSRSSFLMLIFCCRQAGREAFELILTGVRRHGSHFAMAVSPLCDQQDGYV